MGLFGFTEPIVTKGNLLSSADAANIITVGNVQIPEVAYANGTAIDVLAPDTWTDIQDINLGTPFRYQFLGHQTGQFPLKINLAAETSGDYVRAQIEVDGAVVIDISVGASKAQTVGGVRAAVSGNSTPFGINYAKSRVRTRLWKHGTIDQAGSYVYAGKIVYEEVTI